MTPKMAPVASAISSADAATNGSMPICVARGTVSGITRTIRPMSQDPTSRPAMPAEYAEHQALGEQQSDESLTPGPERRPNRQLPATP